jgi:hypothetical protein
MPDVYFALNNPSFKKPFATQIQTTWSSSNYNRKKQPINTQNRTNYTGPFRKNPQPPAYETNLAWRLQGFTMNNKKVNSTKKRRGGNKTRRSRKNQSSFS